MLSSTPNSTVFVNGIIIKALFQAFIPYFFPGCEAFLWKLWKISYEFPQNFMKITFEQNVNSSHALMDVIIIWVWLEILGRGWENILFDILHFLWASWPILHGQCDYWRKARRDHHLALGLCVKLWNTVYRVDILDLCFSTKTKGL